MELTEAIDLIKNAYLSNQSYPTTWADLGCGAGLFARALCHYLGAESKIYAIDQNEFSPKVSIENNCYIIRIRADFEKYLLPAKKLNGILMANSLHYVEDKISFLQNFLLHHSVDVYLIVEYETDAPVRSWVPYPISFKNLSKLFQGFGYRSILQTGTHPSVYGRGRMYAALIQK